MEKKENLEIKMAPEELTAEDLEKVNGGLATCVCHGEIGVDGGGGSSCSSD